MTLTRNGKALAALLIVFVFCDFLLSPLGFETRGSAILGNPASLPWLGLLFGGLILNILYLVLVSFRHRTASILTIIGSTAYILLGFADQAGLVTPISPPALITDVEITTILVLVAALFFGSRVYKESAKFASRLTPSSVLGKSSGMWPSFGEAGRHVDISAPRKRGSIPNDG
jgi:hypothetical protein